MILKSLLCSYPPWQGAHFLAQSSYHLWPALSVAELYLKSFFSCIFHSLVPLLTGGISRAVSKAAPDEEAPTTHQDPGYAICIVHFISSPNSLWNKLVAFDRYRNLGVTPLLITQLVSAELDLSTHQSLSHPLAPPPRWGTNSFQISDDNVPDPLLPGGLALRDLHP